MLGIITLVFVYIVLCVIEKSSSIAFKEEMTDNGIGAGAFMTQTVQDGK